MLSHHTHAPPPCRRVQAKDVIRALARNRKFRLSLYHHTYVLNLLETDQARLGRGKSTLSPGDVMADLDVEEIELTKSASKRLCCPSLPSLCSRLYPPPLQRCTLTRRPSPIDEAARAAQVHVPTSLVQLINVLFTFRRTALCTVSGFAQLLVAVQHQLLQQRLAPHSRMTLSRLATTCLLPLPSRYSCVCPLEFVVGSELGAETVCVFDAGVECDQGEQAWPAARASARHRFDSHHQPQACEEEATRH